MRYLDPNYNPLDDDPKEDYLERIDQFVRDLVWGVRNGKWDARLQQLPPSNVYGPIVKVEVSHEITPQWKQKWKSEDKPSAKDLWAWGYVSKEYDALTPKAFDLLHTPSIAPNVFISYRHKACSSSTLALAIEARLKLLGNNNTFIDKTMNAGDDLKERIDRGLENCDVFVLLMDKEIFHSDWTIYEYQTAVSLGKKVIAVKHPDVIEDDLNTIITKGKKVLDIKHSDVKQDELDKIVAKGFDMGRLFITCHSSGAIDYEKAINELLNVLVV